VAAALATFAIAAFAGAVIGDDESSDGTNESTNLITIELPPEFAPLPRLSGEADARDHWPIARRAWGDSAAGCILIVHELSAKEIDPVAIADGLLAGLSAAGLPAEAKRQDSGDENLMVMAGRLLDPVPGQIKLFTRQEGTLVDASAVACFWGEREPERCAAACESAMSSAESIK